MEAMPISERLAYLKSALPAWQPASDSMSTRGAAPKEALALLKIESNGRGVYSAHLDTHVRTADMLWCCCVGAAQQKHESNRGMTSLGTLDLSIQGW